MKAITQDELEQFSKYVTQFAERALAQSNDNHGLPVVDEYEILRTLFHAAEIIGLTNYQIESQEGMPRTNSLGKALSTAQYSASEIAEIAYNGWEDMNAHDANRWLNWYWQLYNEYEDDVKTIDRMASREHEIRYHNGDWDWKTKTVSAKLKWKGL